MYFNQVEFGQRIREERNRLKMTQEQLALELNISHVHMNRMETGKEGCSIDLLLELSEIFDVSTDYLLKGQLPSNAKTKRQLQEVMDHLEDILQKIED